MSARSYEQYCGLAFALDVIGERWALLVVRELLSGPRRFSDLLAGMPGIATNTLTTRLEELEQHGVIAREQLPPPAASAVYRLTDKGRALEPAIVSLVQWATGDLVQAKAQKRRLAPLRASWVAIALKAFFSVSAARRVKGQIVLELPTGALIVEVKAGALLIRDRVATDQPQAQLTCPEDLVIALVTNAKTLEQAAGLPGVKIAGESKMLTDVLSTLRRGA
jgi:DNA-binding HxlR family transcriptional regulator